MTIEVKYIPSIATPEWHLSEDRRVEIEEILIFDYHCEKDDVFERSDAEILSWYRELRKWRIS